MPKAGYTSYSDEKFHSAFSTKMREEFAITPEDVKRLSDYLGVSVQAVNQYKQGTGFPKTENLVKIAQFYNCSLDYLIGLSPVKTPDADIQAISEYIGLSQEAIELLHYFNDADDELKRNISFINLALSEPIYKPQDGKPFSDTIFRLMDQYIHTGQIKRILDGKRNIPRSLEEYKRQEELREFEEQTVVISTSDNAIEALPLKTLYKADKLRQITEALDYLSRKEEEERKNG